jgi:hypothetical protein
MRATSNTSPDSKERAVSAHTSADVPEEPGTNVQQLSNPHQFYLNRQRRFDPPGDIRSEVMASWALQVD